MNNYDDLYLAFFAKTEFKQLENSTAKVFDKRLLTVALFEDDSKEVVLFFATYDYATKQLVETHTMQDAHKNVLHVASQFSTAQSVIDECFFLAIDTIAEKYTTINHDKFGVCLHEFSFDA